MAKGQKAERMAQWEKDSRQWAVGSKSQTTDYGTTDNQRARSKTRKTVGSKSRTTDNQEAACKKQGVGVSRQREERREQ